MFIWQTLSFKCKSYEFFLKVQVLACKKVLELYENQKAHSNGQSGCDKEKDRSLKSGIVERIAQCRGVDQVALVQSCGCEIKKRRIFFRWSSERWERKTDDRRNKCRSFRRGEGGTENDG